MTYDELASELQLLANAEDWLAVRTWFSYWSSPEEQTNKAILWGRFFLPEYFRDATPEFHRELIRQNFSDQNEYCAAPRGFSKTTLNQLCICFQVANKLDKFIVIVEKSFTEASEVLRSISKIWRDNSMVKQVYGELIKVADDGRSSEKNSDNQGDVFINGVRIRAKGFETPIRGIKADSYRPTKIYMDDVESDEHINSEEQRRKYRENYSQGVVPAIDVTGSIKVRGTILHSDSLLMNLIEQFHGKIFKAFDKNDPEHSLLWPERWSYERLMQKKDEMELQGKGTSSFYKEYLNEPVDDENRPFRIEWLQKEFTDEDIKMKALSRTVVLDVAESLKQGADFTGETIVDWDQDNNWFIQRAKRHKVNITGLVDLIFNIWQYYKPNKIGVEKKAFIDQIKPLLQIRSEETGIYPIVVELEHKGKAKEDRIKGALQGRFEAGKIWFKKGSADDQPALRGELIDFPTGKKDDLCLVGETEVATIFGNKKIKDIKKGEYVITPFGVRKVIESKCTGFREVISSNGLTGTENHPVFVNSKGFTTMDTLAYNEEVNHLTFQSLCKWKYQNLLRLTVSCTNSWVGKESIISANKETIKNEKVLKDYMWRFGNFITNKQFLKATTFTIKIIIVLTTTLVTWSVYQFTNTVRCMLKNAINKTLSSLKTILTKLELKQANGTEVLREESGIVKIVKNNGLIQKNSSVFVKDVVKNLVLSTGHLFSAQMLVLQPSVEHQELIMWNESALSAKASSLSIDTLKNEHVQRTAKSSLPKMFERVYNLTVDKEHAYYANDILVGNCDSLAYHQDIGFRPMGRSPQQQTSMEKEFWANKNKNTAHSFAQSVRKI